MIRLTAQGVSKRFGYRKVLKDISFELNRGDSLAVVGPNGSGKTTLLLTLLGMHRPNSGSVEYRDGDRALDGDESRLRSALVAPYINLYDHLTAEENLVFFATVSGGRVTGKTINSLLNRVGLEGRGGDYVAGYSSGMKQRLKYAVALLREPDFLFLDEPTSNLDDEGRQTVREIIDEYRSRAVVVLATNEAEEQKLAGQICRVAQ
jgi:heme exporter protein A